MNRICHRGVTQRVLNSGLTMNPFYLEDTLVTKMMKKLTAVLCTAAIAGMAASPAMADDISGAGATFPYPIYAKWAEAYKKSTNVGLNYQSIGSGGGIKQIKAATVTFGASDKPLTPDELKEGGLVQFPMIIGGVVPVVNVPGVKPGAIVLDGATIAGIYLGEISKWDDARVKKLNPGLALPSLAIAPIYRSDGSGTNFLFTSYLSSVSATFKTKVGANSAVEWPSGIGAKGNEGVANMTSQTSGAIGYVEYAYAKQNNMTYAKMVNGAGKTVSPEIKTFQAAAANADWAKAEGYYLVLTNQPGAESWPITGASFILMHRESKDAAASATALKFFAWAYKSGGEMATQLDYVPLPANVVKQVEQTWMSSIHAGGKPVWNGK
jgi:phosphate transport system substrate-binding protein